MSIIRPVRPPLVAPVVSPFGLGLPWQSGGALPLLAPSAPTISGTVTIGGTLTITPGAGGGPVTSNTLYRDGVAVGTVATGYAWVAADLAPSATGGAPPVLDVRSVGPGGTSGPSNTLAWALPTANFKGDWNSFSASFYTLVSGRVSALLDQSGAGNNLTQGAAGSRPVIAAAGAPDGVHDAFDFALNAGVTTALGNVDIGLSTGPVTIYTVAQAPASSRYWCDGAANNTRVIYNNGTQMVLYAGGSVCQVAATPGTWYVGSAVFNGASSKQNINGETDATGNPGASTSAGHTLGASQNGSTTNAANCKIARQLVYAAAHDAATRAAIVAYLRGWSGV